MVKIIFFTSGSLSHCYREEIDNVDDNASARESFKYKTERVGKSIKKIRATTTTTTKSKWILTTMTTATRSPIFKCWSNYFTQIS